MESNFYNQDFEELIKQKADQYKMYPSDKVWKEINRSLHSRRKWYWFGFVLLLSGVSYYSINELVTPSTKKPGAAKNENPANTKETNNTAKTGALIIPFATVVNPPKTGLPPNNAEANISAEENNNNIAYVIDGNNNIVSETSPNSNTEELYNNNLQSVSPIAIDIRENYSNNNHLNEINIPDNVAIDATASPEKTENFGDKIVQEEDIPKINWLQDYALYELIVPKTKRTSWQLSFSPTMNYRKLTGARNARIKSDVKNIPIALNIEGDVEGLVNHKPALGFELGTAVLYAANKNISLKVGAQFNYSRYSIKAYSSYLSERATIALNNNGSGSSNSLNSFTQLRNFGGNEAKEIQNQYFQFSVPIGAELRLLGSERLQLHVAGTIQPTYLLNRNTYLITTDYKNYTKEPSLIRRWNVNAGAEAFILYKTGGVKWQVGPNFRYQLFSSYVNTYPIKEYLMEYGIKIGVTKTIR